MPTQTPPPWFEEQNQQNMNFTQKNIEYLVQINVTFAVASQRQFQKCVASPWQVPLLNHLRSKVCSFSSFLCLPSSKRTAHKDML